MRLVAGLLAPVLLAIGLATQAGCHPTPTRILTREPVTVPTALAIGPQTARPPATPATVTAPSALDGSDRALDRVFASWPEALLSIEATSAARKAPIGVDRVQVLLPCMVRIDANAAFSWIEALTSHLDSPGPPARSGRMLASRSTTAAHPDRCRSPIISLETIEVPIDDDRFHVGLVLVDGDHPGAFATRTRLDRATDLLPLLEAIDRPRSVRLLAIDAAGRVIHGVSLPLLPMAKSRPEAPQALLSPWWIRDRRTAPQDPVVWRNAAQWLAHGRTLATAARELPETVGDILFLPMLGWQSTIVAAPWAVGGVEFDLTIELPSDVAERIDRFEFHLGDA